MSPSHIFNAELSARVGELPAREQRAGSVIQHFRWSGRVQDSVCPRHGQTDRVRECWKNRVAAAAGRSMASTVRVFGQESNHRRFDDL